MKTTFYEDAFVPASGPLSIQWLGQSGFILHWNGRTIVLDPYLSTRLERITNDSRLQRHVRMMPPPIAPESLTGVTDIVCSHDHADHLDPETIVPLMKASPKARIIVPPAAVQALEGLGIKASRIVPVGDGTTRDVDGLSITGIAGMHNAFDYHEETGYPYLGYLLEIGGLKLYHAGDTIMFDALRDRLKALEADIALLPINGGDYERFFRGFMSNMTYYQAADLAAYMNTELVIPTHFDMFTINTENIAKFEGYMRVMHPDIPYWTPRTGGALVIE